MAPMATYAVLLRGVNVGGHNKVPMRALQELLASDGHRDVRTYVQSGNVVLRTRLGADALAARVESLLAEAMGLSVPSVVRSGPQLAEIVAANPFLAPGRDPGRQLHVAFLAADPDPEGLAGLDPRRAAPEELSVRGRDIYLWCPEGLGQSKVMQGVERRLATAATVRNWRTVTELLRMADDGD